MKRALVSLVLAVAACQSSGQPTPSTDLAQASPTAPAATPGRSSPSSAPALTPIPGCLPACVTGKLMVPGDLPAGDYTTEHFFGGQLTITVPAGWTSFEDSTGEFALRPPDVEAGALLFWIDIYAAVDPGSTPVPGVERTVDGVLEWLRENPNLEVLEERPATLGGLTAVALELGRAAAATNVDPGCPSELQPCVGLFSYPEWGDGFFSEGGPFHLRLIAAEATWGGQAHAVYAMIDAADEELFAAIARDDGDRRRGSAPARSRAVASTAGSPRRVVLAVARATGGRRGPRWRRRRSGPPCRRR